LSNYENDKREISSDLLFQLNEKFNLDVLYILTGVKDEKQLSNEEEQLLQYFNICDKDTKEDIIRIVKRCSLLTNKK
jgi:transcriptional regulator with XRE-family HTH domain